MSTELMIHSRGKCPSHAASSSSHRNWRDWSNLGEGPAGLIAEHLLANDVADYICFRAVCCAWRRCSIDPRNHGILDRRFHPRNWIMLRETAVAPDHRRLLLNVSTGQCIRVPLPELSGHHVFGPTTEGLLVLLHRASYAVRLLNPLTGHITDLPPATTLLRLDRYTMWSDDDDIDPADEFDLTDEFKVLAAGLADDSTFAVYFRGIRMVVVAKPGDECWTLVDHQTSLDDSLPISFQGHFYCPTEKGLMMVDTAENQPPRLVMAAVLTEVFPCRSSSVHLHLVDHGGELTLVYRKVQQQRMRTDKRYQMSGRIKESVEYKAYRVDLKAMDTKPILGLGGSAVFLGLRSALSVSTSVFPSIKSDSIYVGLDIELGTTFENEGVYCLTDGSLIDGPTDPYGIFEQHVYGECGSKIGPWGINDYLSWYVTDTHNVASVTWIKCIYDDD